MSLLSWEPDPDRCGQRFLGVGLLQRRPMLGTGFLDFAAELLGEVTLLGLLAARWPSPCSGSLT